MLSNSRASGLTLEVGAPHEVTGSGMVREVTALHIRKIKWKRHDINIGQIIASTGNHLNEFLEKAEKGAGDIGIKGVSGAHVFVKRCCDIDKANFVVHNLCVKSALENGTEEGVT